MDDSVWSASRNSWRSLSRGPISSQIINLTRTSESKEDEDGGVLSDVRDFEILSYSNIIQEFIMIFCIFEEIRIEMALNTIQQCDVHSRLACFWWVEFLSICICANKIYPFFHLNLLQCLLIPLDTPKYFPDFSWVYICHLPPRH